MENTRILTCKCNHEEQDKMYGSKKRVMNRKKQNSTTGPFDFCCTVCGSTQLVSSDKKK